MELNHKVNEGKAFIYSKFTQFYNAWYTTYIQEMFIE